MKSKSIIISIVEQRCPRCQSEELFVKPPYHFKGFAGMHDHCPNCEQSLDPEPGFSLGPCM